MARYEKEAPQKRKRRRKIAVIDAETDPFQHGRSPKPFVWGFYDGENYVEFWDDDLDTRDETCTFKLVRYLHDKDCIVFAHNGGKFDFFFLLEYLNTNIFIVNGRIAKANIGDVSLRDSYLFLPLPLSAHKKDDIDYLKMEVGRRAAHREEISRYLRGDCTYLYEWVDKYITRFGLRMTVAGTAFNELKKTGYKIGRTPPQFDARFREFYYGGRVQCFDVGIFKGEYEFVDIKSSYPNAMLKEHPYTRNFRVIKTISDTEKPAFYRVRAVSNGVLPYRGKTDNKLYFPHDDVEREYCATSWEIKVGLEYGTLKIKKVCEGYIFDETKDFSEYVNKFYGEKLQAEIDGDDDTYTFSKLMLNSPYGKFGQNGREFKDFCILPYGELPTTTGWELYADTDTDTPYSIFVKDAPDDKFYNVATAGSVTGFARAYLYRGIVTSENPLYCDTDSLLCTKFNERMGCDIGDWERKAKVTEAYIAQRKMYAMKTTEVEGGEFKWMVASKGVNLWASDIVHAMKHNKNLIVDREAPAFSLKYGARFFDREIDFENIYDNNEFKLD